MRRLLDDVDVLQLILNRHVDPDDGDAQEEAMEYITPYWYVPNVTTSAGTFITFDIGGFSRGTGAIHKTSTLGMYVFSHHNLMSVRKSNYSGTLPQKYKTGTRVDLLNKHIQTIFNGSYDFGIGAMKLIKDNPKQINDANYYGRELVFEVSDYSNVEDCADDI